MRNLVGTVAVLLVFSSASAEAQPPRRPRASPYQKLVDEGLEHAVARRFEDAKEALGRAIALDGSRPEAHYGLACVLRMSELLTEALAEFRTTVSLAQKRRMEWYALRGLQGVADTLERTEEGLQPAREAWKRVAAFTEKHRSISSPLIARTRLASIDARIKQQLEYEGVRQRIAEHAEAEESNTTRGEGNVNPRPSVDR